jgi:hypothetical protein
MHECGILSSLLLLTVTWHYLWFILNPAYGPEKFSREHTPWVLRRRWLLEDFPLDYVVAFVLSVAFWILECVSEDATFFEVVNGLFVYFIWGFLLGVVSNGPDAAYRRWRAAKKPESAYQTEEKPALPPETPVPSPPEQSSATVDSP